MVTSNVHARHADTDVLTKNNLKLNLKMTPVTTVKHNGNYCTRIRNITSLINR